MKTHLVRVVAAACISVAPAFGQMGPPGGGGGMGMMEMPMMEMPMMKEHMARMQEHLDKLKAAKTDHEKIVLMQEHMELMHEHMKMMMDARGQGGMGGKPAAKPVRKGAPAATAEPARPDAGADADHRQHHPD